MGDIYVFLEAAEDLQLLSHGNQLAEERHCGLVAISKQSVPVRSQAFYRVRKIYCIPDWWDENKCAVAITEICAENKPDILLFPATIFSRMTAPLVAADLKAGLVADCTTLEWTADGFLQTRPAFGSSCLAGILTMGTPQIATVRRGAVGSRCYGESGEEPEVVELSKPGGVSGKGPLRVMSTPRKKEQDLYNAEIIVSGGFGVGSAEGFKLLETLASKLSAGLGASRAAVNAGFAPYRCQVGLTGQIVRPKLYLAFGISGAVQHLVGMEAAETVIAVNRDPRAPIFSYADYGLVSDWEPTARRLLELLDNNPNFNNPSDVKEMLLF